MRLHSTTASIRAGEFTWLAIAECVFSTALYLAVAHHLHSFHYYALAIALAPLALLRTDAAVNWALVKYQRTNSMGQALLAQWSHGERYPVIAIARVFFVFVVVIAWGFIYRVVSV